MRSYVTPRQTDWDEHLGTCEFAINSSQHAGTRCIPFKVVYGTLPAIPLDHDLHQLQDNKVQSVDDLIRSRQISLQDAKKNIIDANEASSKQANKHRRDIEFAVGDYVYLKTSNITLPQWLSRKLAAQWIGPFPVESVVSRVAYRLTLPPRFGRLHPVFHVSLLKTHHGALPLN